MKVLVGTNDLTSGGQRYKIKEMIRHEQYNQPSFANDIGLIRIDGRIEFNEKVQPIKYSDKFVEGGTHLQTTGWGRLNVSYNFEQFFLNQSNEEQFEFSKIHKINCIIRQEVRYHKSCKC